MFLLYLMKVCLSLILFWAVVHQTTITVRTGKYVKDTLLIWFISLCVISFFIFGMPQ